MLTVYEGVVVKHLEDSPAHVLALTLALTDTTSRQGSLYRTPRKATFCQKLLSGDPQGHSVPWASQRHSDLTDYQVLMSGVHVLCFEFQSPVSLARHPPLQSSSLFFFPFNVFTTSHTMWDLSSPTRDQTCVSCIGSTES